ncbi:MAG: hypothetical protein P8X61_06955 [Limibacillus sp.]
MLVKEQKEGTEEQEAAQALSPVGHLPEQRGDGDPRPGSRSQQKPDFLGGQAASAEPERPEGELHARGKE